MREFLTIEEVAAWLQIHPVTVYKLARRGKIPHIKIGRTYRFQRRALVLWLETISGRALDSCHRERQRP